MRRSGLYYRSALLLQLGYLYANLAYFGIGLKLTAKFSHQEEQEYLISQIKMKLFSGTSNLKPLLAFKDTRSH